MPFSHSIAKNAGFVSRLHLTGLSVFSGALTGRLTAVALVFACLLGGLVPDQLHAQNLSFLNNYFVSGDHIARDFVPYSGQPTNGFVNGRIYVPDRIHDSEGVPDGSDIVAAFLYWQVLEPTSPPSPDPGSFALFNGYSITGDVVGNDQSACGSETTFVRSYRANVLPYLPVNANGSSQAATTHTVGLPVNPNGSPSLPGGSLVIVYRVLSGAPWPPLKATVIYDGSLEVSGPVPNGNLDLLMGGFYDAVSSDGTDIANAKITDIHSTMSCNGATASFDSFYHHTSPQGVADHASTVPEFNPFSLLTSQYGVFTTAVFTTRVHSGDGDGLLDIWKHNLGYCDVSVNPVDCGGPKDPSWVDLTGATIGEKDIFVQYDYMVGNTPQGHSHQPPQDALNMVTNAFANNIVNPVHVHFVQGNPIPEDTCADDTSQTPPLLCMFPGEPGAVAWKLGLEALKAWPTNLDTTSNPPACTGGVCTPRFQPGRKDSYHYVLFGHSLALPTWSVADPIYTLKSIVVTNGNATVTTSATLTSCPSRVTIDGAIATPNLNGVYATIMCPSPLNTTFTISNVNANKTPPVADGTYPNTPPEPFLAVYASKTDCSIYPGCTDTTSGYSDVGGGDIAVTLGKWSWDNQFIWSFPACSLSEISLSPQCLNGLAGTLMHELGHNLTLLHGGRFYPGNPASSTPEPSLNCKPNYQSVMNYLFQVDLLQDANGGLALDYSSQALAPLDETNFSVPSGLGSNPAPTYPYTKWFRPALPRWMRTTLKPADSHCDGTPKGPNETAYEMEGRANPIAWSNMWDINFDGGLEVLDGYGNNDWSIIDPRQIGASGNDNVGGPICPPNQSLCNNVSNAYLFGSYYFGPNGGLRAGGGGGLRAGGGGGLRAGGGGGVGEPNYNTIDSYPRPPRAVTATGGVVTWKPATFGNIVQYNVYRVNGATTILIASVEDNPTATNYSYTDNGAPAGSTYLVTTVDLDPVSNLPRESTPQGAGAFQADLTLAVSPTPPLTYGSSATLSTTGGSSGGAVTFYLLSGPCSLSGNQLTANSGTGTCSVAATMAGDSTYNPVTSAAVTVTLITNWTASGFYPPVVPTASGATTVWNYVKGGRTVPLKFNIYAGTVQETSTAAVQNGTVKVYPMNCGTGVVNTATDTLQDTGATALRYDTTGGQFIQNWQTPKGAGKCYQAVMTAADNFTMLQAYFWTN